MSFPKLKELAKYWTNAKDGDGIVPSFTKEFAHELGAELTLLVEKLERLDSASYDLSGGR